MHHSGTLTDFRASKLRVRWHSWGEAGTWFAKDELREGKVDLVVWRKTNEKKLVASRRVI